MEFRVVDLMIVAMPAKKKSKGKTKRPKPPKCPPCTKRCKSKTFCQTGTCNEAGGLATSEFERTRQELQEHLRAVLLDRTKIAA